LTLNEHTAAHPPRFKLLITIADRGKGDLAVPLLIKEGSLYHRIALGRGTARTEMLDLLGIGETPKDILFSILPEVRAHKAMHRLRHTLQFDNPGHGIAFSIAMGSVAGQSALDYLGSTAIPGDTPAKEHMMDNNGKQYDLIIAIVGRGYAEEVMNAARPAGAQGGTILHARGAGTQEAEKFFGITIQPEKEMVFILTRRESKRAIMQAVCQHAGFATQARGMVFSLPAEDVMGVVHMLREDDEE
jgi:nitrogen regulatory protein PII